MEQYIQTIKEWLGSGSINLFGYPFAGKDTQGKILADMLDGVVISSGELLRQSKDHPKLQAVMATGQNIPSELFFELVLPHLKADNLLGKPLILSEMGRKNLSEAQGTITVTNDAGHPQKAVVLLTLSDDEVWRRFEQSKIDNDRGQRADDNPAILQTRLDKFKHEIVPVIDFYRNNGQLLEVDGSPSREEVTKSILVALAAKATS